MKFQLQTIERKEVGAEKKPIIKANIKDTQGAVTEGVTIWSSFPNFANLKDGDVVEGDLKIEVKGKFTNKTLNPSPTGKPVYGSPRASSGAITKAMEKKEASIEKFQDNKELSIKVSSTMRDAVLLAVAEYTKDQSRPLDELVIKWRGFLLTQWDKIGTDDHIPF